MLSINDCHNEVPLGDLNTHRMVSDFSAPISEEIAAKELALAKEQAAQKAAAIESRNAIFTLAFSRG